MSTTGKTPVSILQETLLRQGVVPFYDLMQSGVGTHLGVFTYRVTAGTIEAVGSGRSKKEAKHEAAKLALEQMKVTTPEPLDEEVLQQNVTSPYEASLKDNAIGTLGDICATHELPIPEYNLIREDGPPHAKMFVFSCKVSNMDEMAQGRTKKQAKQLAAYKMLNHFTELKLYNITLEQEDTEGETSGINSELASKSQKTPVPIGTKIADMDITLIDLWTKKKLTNLRALKMPIDNPVEELEDICKELGIDAVFDDSLKECGGADGLLLNLSTKPIAVFFGAFPDAKEQAATKALQYLKVMTYKEDLDLPLNELINCLPACDILSPMENNSGISYHTSSHAREFDAMSSVHYM